MYTGSPIWHPPLSGCLYKAQNCPTSIFSQFITIQYQQSTSFIALRGKMKLAGVCIVLLALATASYATPYRFGEQEERANQQDVLVDLLQKLIQQQQLQENQALAQQGILDIFTKLFG